LNILRSPSLSTIFPSAGIKVVVVTNYRYFPFLAISAFTAAFAPAVT